MKFKWIIGNGSFLEIAYDAWSRSFPEIEIEKITIPQDNKYNFDLTPLDYLHPDKGSIFVAIDSRFGNFKRAELLKSALERGFKIEPFISTHAIVAADVRVGLNSFIADRTIIGQGSRLDYNSIIMPGAQIGSQVTIGSSCWIESGVIVGDNVKIGAHSSLRMGSIISKGLNIGRGCDIGWPNIYKKDIPSKTFYDIRYSEPIYVYSG